MIPKYKDRIYCTIDRIEPCFKIKIYKDVKDAKYLNIIIVYTLNAFLILKYKYSFF